MSGSGSLACIYIFNVEDEEYLRAYNRTGWEFTCPDVVAIGALSLGVSALVTIPVSTFLLIIKKRSRKARYSDIVWKQQKATDMR